MIGLGVTEMHGAEGVNFKPRRKERTARIMGKYYIRCMHCRDSHVIQLNVRRYSGGGSRLEGTNNTWGSVKVWGTTTGLSVGTTLFDQLWGHHSAHQ